MFARAEPHCAPPAAIRWLRPGLALSGKWLAISAALALLGLLSGCSTRPVHPARAPIGQPSDYRSQMSPEQARDVTVYALGLVGTPYRYGGNTPDTGFDCSGLIRHVYQTSAGIQPPRTVALLRDWGESLTSEALRTGDLVVFFQNDVATHAGIYVGQNRFVHAPSTGGTVRLDSLRSRYWAAQVATFRRP